MVSVAPRLRGTEKRVGSLFIGRLDSLFQRRCEDRGQKLRRSWTTVQHKLKGGVVLGVIGLKNTMKINFNICQIFSLYGKT